MSYFNEQPEKARNSQIFFSTIYPSHGRQMVSAFIVFQWLLETVVPSVFTNKYELNLGALCNNNSVLNLSISCHFL